MRLLFVTANLPFPPRTGSTLVAYHHLEQLSRRHTVDLVTYKTRGSENIGPLADWCGGVELIERLPRWRLAVQRLLGVARGVPIQVAHTYSAAMASAVERRLTGPDAYDAVILHLTETVQFLPGDFAGAALWMLEDPPVLKLHRLAEGRGRLARLRASASAMPLRHFERRWAREVDCVTLLNRRDAADYERHLPGARLSWVPYGVDVEPTLPDDFAERRQGMIVISGNMFHPPNVEAVDLFCRAVLPKVRQQMGDAQLWLVGADPAPLVQRWGQHPGVHITGAVPSVRDYVRQAVVSVCTVRLAIGTQTKVLEALATGTPVVTTTAGNHGVEGVDGRHLYVADDPDHIAARVVSLLRREEWHALSTQGHAFARDTFSWERSTARLEEILVEATTRRA